MVRVSPPSLSAASGELSELMYARRDFVRFQNGARALRGFISLPEGPVTRLPGTRLMGFTKNNAPARLMAFQFRDEDAVLLEWTDLLLRFWRNGALVASGPGPYSIATPYPAAALPALQPLQSADRIYLTDGLRPPQTLSRFALANWTIAATAFAGGPFAPRNLDETVEIGVSAVTGVVTLTATAAIFGAHHIGTPFQLFEIDTSDTPYWAADIDARVGDRVYYNGRVYRIAAFDDQTGRTGLAEPAVSGLVIASDRQVLWTYVGAGNTGSYAPWAANALLKLGDRRHLPLANITAEVNGFASGSGATDRKTGVNPPVHLEGNWLSEPSGPVWQALHDGNGIVRISSITSPTVAVGTVEKRLPDGLLTKATYRWAEAAWSDMRGWPVALGGFEQRHIYAGSKTEPRTFWTSVIGGTTDMASGDNDDDGFSYILPSLPKKFGEIRSVIQTGDVLYLGTSADTLTGRATEQARAFARETCRFSSDGVEGAGPTPPVVVDNSPVFIDASGARLVAMSIDANTGKFRADVLTQIARHILAPGALRLVYQDLPVPIIWALLADGQIAGLTYVPSQQVAGFHRHDIGGGFVEDIEVLPSDDGRSQHLWLVVRRTLAGVERRCIERMEHPFIALDGAAPDMTDAWHQFAAFRWTGAASTTIDCPDHFEGETVLAWTDLGAFSGVVTSGVLTLPRPVLSAIVGIDGTAAQRFDGLDIVSGQPDGGDDGRLRTARGTGIRLHRSAGGSVQVIGITDGLEQALDDPVPFINLATFETPSLRNGVVEVSGIKGWDHQKFLRILPAPGAPLTVTARTPTTMITDD